MKGYFDYVHDISDARKPWFPWSGIKKKNVADYRMKLSSINELQAAILKESDEQVLDFVSEHLNLKENLRNIVFSSKDKSYVESADLNDIHAIINFKPINEIKHLNLHFSSVNKLLPDTGIYIGRVETYWERKIRFFNRFGRHLGQLVWLIDFPINRVLPKVRPFGYLYRFFSSERVHPRSKAEVLGRLVYNGFEIIEFSVINNLLYFVVMKTRKPLNDPQPTYHALVKLRRVGKGGKPIDVYKLRTMHPYSEYLQDYVIKLNGYNKAGKPANDFRVARWGKIMRKVWLDELPQLINVLKGEMKLVGVRPLSRVRFNEFPEDVQQERIKYKPGCIPPYIALLMPGDSDNMEAERIYFNDLAINPYTTDIKYLIKSIYNIVFSKIKGS